MSVLVLISIIGVIIDMYFNGLIKRSPRATTSITTVSTPFLFSTEIVVMTSLVDSTIYRPPDGSYNFPFRLELIGFFQCSTIVGLLCHNLLDYHVIV